MKNIKRKIIVIVGPTASGKTEIGVKLAKAVNGEIVSADSRQIFRGLDIGTGKDLFEYEEIKYHLIDICDPGENFNLFKYLELSRSAIEDIFSRGKTPIIVGGTGLYIQALIQGFQLKPIQNSKFKIQNESRPSTRDYSREQLNHLTMEDLQDVLKSIDLNVYKNLADKKNPHRLIRAIEKAQSGEIVTKVKPDFEALQIGLDWSRGALNERIDKRVDDRFRQGMMEEVVDLLKSGVDPVWLMKLGLEYRIITQFIISDSKATLNIQMKNDQINEKWSTKKIMTFESMSQTLKLRSHQYAKRQMTWFKRFPEIFWESDFRRITVLVKAYLSK